MAVTRNPGYGRCSIEHCNTVGKLKLKLCGKHYQRQYFYGDPLHLERRENGSEPYTSLLFYGHTRVGECLVFNGLKDKKGYGRIAGLAPGPKTLVAHRVSYEKWNGPVPPGMVVDHECHNEAAHSGLCAGGSSCIHRACINPAHLRAVPSTENSAASPHAAKGREPMGLGAINKAKTHCPQGHSYSGTNLRISSNGARFCRACDKTRNAKAYQKRTRATKEQ
jgi:HNH endonuclease